MPMPSIPSKSLGRVLDLAKHGCQCDPFHATWFVVIVPDKSQYRPDDPPEILGFQALSPDEYYDAEEDLKPFFYCRVNDRGEEIF